MHPALQGLITIIVGVGGCVGYFYFSNQFLDKVRQVRIQPLLDHRPHQVAGQVFQRSAATGKRSWTSLDHLFFDQHRE